MFARRVEGETLARRFTLNPVLVIISLVFWFWMWGIPGAILSMPMLAITKIICDGVRPLAALGHFLERGETQPLSEALFYLAYIAEFILHQFLHSLVLISGLSCKTTFKPALPRAARRGQANDNQNNVRHFVSFRSAHIHRPALAQRPRGR
jgi:hypothetical protein